MQTDVLDSDLGQLLLGEARKYVATGELPWAPGYRVAIEENPGLWDVALKQVASETERERERALEMADALQGSLSAQEAQGERELEALVPSLEQLFELRQRLGRKFEPNDVTAGMRTAAEAFAKSYDGDFPFMQQMREEAKAHRLSAGQAKGVLNSMTARKPPPPTVGRVPGQPVPEDVITDGIYLHDGKVVKVQKAVHGSGHLYAKVLVVGDEDEFDLQHGYHHGGRANAHFEYAQGLIRQLKIQERMTLEQAKRFGALYGVCCSCGATLTDETSIEAGIGPVCGRRFA